MKNKFLLITIFCLAFYSSALAKNFTTYSIASSTVEKLLPWVDENTIVLINLEHTLLMPQAQMFQDIIHQGFIKNLLYLGKQNPTYQQAVIHWYQQHQQRLVEPDWQNFINKLKQKRALVFGLFQEPTFIANIAPIQLNKLYQLGVRFNDNISQQSKFVIKKSNIWFSKFYDGVIFSGRYNITEAVKDLLQLTRFTPKKLLIIHHQENVLKQFQRELAEYNIDTNYLLYLQHQQILQQTTKTNLALARLQQDMLVYQYKWLEDEPAIELLRRQQAKPSK